MRMEASNMLKIGSGYMDNIADTLHEGSVSGKILYVSDNVVDRLYGDRVKKQLHEVGKVREEFVNYNTISYAMSVAERVIATDVECIVALGGGKVLDVCKYAAYISKTRLLSIPTTMANDGIASPIAVLKRKDEKPKSLGCAMPAMLIVDTDVIMESPVELIKAGIGDTISNYLALKDWEFACAKNMDEMNGYAYLMSKTSIDALMKTQYTSICPEFINVLGNSLVLSGVAMKFAGSSRPVSGSEHLFSHALDYYSEKKNLHGIQVALGTVAILKLIEHTVDEVIGYLNRFEVDINPKRIGIEEEVFLYCMQNATTMRSNRYTYLNEIDLSSKRLKKIYKELVEDL